MDTLVSDKPNLQPEVVPVQNLSTGLEAIAQKMAAMRNQVAPTKAVETGTPPTAVEEVSVAPEGVEISDEDSEPEVDVTEANDTEATDEAVVPDEVNTADSQPSDIIDFIQFANDNPNAKFKFTRNGK